MPLRNLKNFVLKYLVSHVWSEVKVWSQWIKLFAL